MEGNYIFEKLINKLKYFKILNKSSKEKAEAAINLEPKSKKIAKDINQNLKMINDIFAATDDLVTREFSIGNNQVKALIVHIEGMTEKTIIDENILGSLMWETKKTISEEKISIKNIKNSLININEIKELKRIEEIIDVILAGDAILFINGFATALQLDTRAWEHRGVQKPESEVTVRGPKEGFTETLSVNISQIRRKIKDPNLKFETSKIGKRTRTETAVVYIKDIANEKIVKEVKNRLDAINTDAILESGYIEEFIEDNPLSIFPTIGNTETPDKFAAKILEGRVGILVDGTPFALTVPCLFIENLHVTEDYYSRPFLASVIRIVRLIALHISLFGPALYVAVTSFHPEIIPIQLLITILTAMEGTPFPAFIELLLMGLIFEILREGGLRLPLPVGQAIGIVGGIILGEMAVAAGIVGAPVVIVISLAAIATFVLPAQTDMLTLLRAPMIILAATFGLFGLACGYIFVLIHMVSLRSFGVAYMSPLMPFIWQDLKDTIIRVPWWMMNKRPKISRDKIFQRNSKRMQSDLKPATDKNTEADDKND